MLTAGYVANMAGVWDSGAYDPVNAPLGGTGSYSASQASFVSAADKVNANDSGIAFAGVVYKNETDKVQAWDYEMVDLYNTFFAQYDHHQS